jgi:uncharacterized protein YjbJ (UPF0337 family)
LEIIQEQGAAALGDLTNDDLNVIKGKRTELAGRLQQRYGYQKEEAEKQNNTWLGTLN